MKNGAVIFYHPDGVEKKRDKLMGRHAAGQGFLKGYVRHSGLDEFHAFTLSAPHFKDFVTHVHEVSDAQQPCRRAAAKQIGKEGFPSTLMSSGPHLSPFAWRRRMIGPAAFSLCGVNHTVASARVMDNLGALVTSPLEHWDALICTSEASKAAMKYVMDSYSDYLGDRIGIKPASELMMPVIPLGVDCSAFERSAAVLTDRNNLRTGLGISEDDIALLFVGRLSFHAKAHPLPMYLAAQAAARRSGKRVHIIQAGWFANDSIERQFREAAQVYCTSVNVMFLDGRDDDVRRRIWRAADVFISLSDNIQETFGLTPIEAMAAGLPVVVSDWNGYRETVSDGVHGFTIPTWMPAAGSGDDMIIAPELDVLSSADEHVYDRYCGEVSQSTVVDTDTCADALSILCSDDGKRRAMGAAGRDHAAAVYDWSVIVSQYQELWAEQDERRTKASDKYEKIKPSLPPLRVDPFRMFESYPTKVIGRDTELRLVDGVDEATLGKRLALNLNSFASDRLIDEKDMKEIVALLAEAGSLPFSMVRDKLSGIQEARLVRSVGWLAKMHIIRLSGSGGVRNSESTNTPETSAPEPMSRASTRGDYDAALDILEGRAQNVPDNEDEFSNQPYSALMARALEARTIGDVNLAAQCLHRASALIPDEVDVNVNVGELLAGGGRYDSAIESFRKALSTHENSVRASINLGKTLFLRGDEAEGIHSLRRAVRIAPEDGEARYTLGACLRRVGAHNEAAQCLKIAVELDADLVEARYHLAQVYKTLGRTDDAVQTLSGALERQPTNRFVQAAILTLAAERSGERPRDTGRAKKIAMHLRQQSDFNILYPVFQAIGHQHWLMMSADATEISSFQPDAVLVAHTDFAPLRSGLNGTQIIHVPSTPARAAEEYIRCAGADVVCAVNEEDQAALVSGGLPHRRVWLTGLPSIDPLFSGALENIPAGTGARQQILFAPSADPHQSCGPTLSVPLASLCDHYPDKYHVTIAPHVLTREAQPGWMSGWRALVAGRDDMTLIEDHGANLLELMGASDLMISDASNAAFLYLAFDKPLILMSNEMSEESAPNRQQQDYLKRVAHEITSPELLASAVEAVLEKSDHASEHRARVRGAVFGSYADGKAGHRIGAGLTEHLT